jgi:phospholipase/lecithinase/hemolysin
MMHIAARFIVVVFAALTLSAQGWVSQVVVFGDSLSDTGNFWTKMHPTDWPYVGKGASNGPLAVEKMADIYKTPLVNFAWFGATTGVGNEADSGTQTALGTAQLPGVTTAYLAAKAAGLEVDPQAVYVVWAGPNDLRTNGTSPAALATAVTNLVAIVRDLESAGAKHILAPGMPDLGLTPGYVGTIDEEQATAVSDAFNALLTANLPRKVNYFDTAGWMRQIFAKPAAYGFVNVTQPCLGTPGCLAAPDTFFFWDTFHPTTAAHALMGELFAECAQTRSGGRSAHCRAGLGPEEPKGPPKKK